MSIKKESRSSAKSPHPESILDETEPITRNVSVQMVLVGETSGPVEWNFFVMFDGAIIYDTKWHDGDILELGILPFDLIDPDSHTLLTEMPLILLLRSVGGKGNVKDPDPLTHIDNRAGGTVDLLPFVMGENEIHVKVRLLTPTGEEIGCKVKVHAYAWGPEMEPVTQIPLVMTLVSAHCLPAAKEGTVYVAALGLDGVVDPYVQNFGMSLGSPDFKKAVWASTCSGLQIACTAYNCPNEDKYIPSDLEIQTNDMCTSVYWHSVKRVLVDPNILKARLENRLHIEIAGVPRTGKIDVRGRYMGLIDARVLLIPAQASLATCAKLEYFVETNLPENIGPMLILPPTSAKASAREPIVLLDAQGHTPYVVIQFDIWEPIASKRKLGTLFEIIGFPPPDKRMPIDELYLEPPPDDTSVDVRKIRAEGGGLAVHKELGSLACRGAVPMTQGIKRTAANKLLVRVRTMLKQFSPGNCSNLEWQDTVTGQHSAARRAVTASFRPQPPPKKITPIVAAARCRTAGDYKLADKHIEHNLEVAQTHPRVLVSKALRLLEARLDSQAKNYVLRGLSSHSRNRFLLWIYGAMEFDKGEEAMNVAMAAFRIATKGDYSDGTGTAIAWGALHTLHHVAAGNPYSSFVAAKKMRKAYELNKEWRVFYQRWLETSGEEEIYWVPEVLRVDNPLLLAAAFFLCLRCYNFSEKLLQCLEQGCATRGSRLGLKTKIKPDIYYLRAAALVLKKQPELALEVTLDGVKRFGPSAMMSQMRATCLMMARGCDWECVNALEEAERAGAEISVSLLLQAAAYGMKKNPDLALQRAARVHKEYSSAYSALLISQIFRWKRELSLSERWAAVAVKFEPFLADGWAMLALLAITDRNVDKARACLRTARQVGPISLEIEKQIKKATRIFEIATFSDFMSKNVCFCDYFNKCE